MGLYSFNERMKTAKEASSDIEKYLRCNNKTSDVINVENDKKYQKLDVDLLYRYSDSNGHQKECSIEIKGDKKDGTGNFFLEEESNCTKHTLGCILATRSTFLFYYFVNTGNLYIFRTKQLQQWFVKNKNRFELKQKTGTTSNDGKKVLYMSSGRTVPIKTLVNEIPVKFINITNYIKKTA